MSTKPTVNIDFATALRAAADQAGHAALVTVIDAAISHDHGAAEHVGSIMHGATWMPCPTCHGSGKQGRKRCPGCKGCAEHPTFREREIRPIRAAAFAALGL